jgi:hypothetical protein
MPQMQAQPDLALWFGSPAASQHARTFAVRIVSLDYYYAPPLPGLDPTVIPGSGTPIPKVCVLRVFGSTPSGQKTCLHVHQVQLSAALCLHMNTNHTITHNLQFFPVQHIVLYNHGWHTAARLFSRE